VGGCLGALVTTPPVVTVTGVSNGHSYLFGNVPAPGCHTTDKVTVAHSATLRVTGGSQGAGEFTATCSGAVDMAGNQQKAPVHASYLVRYGITAFLAPLPGSTVKRSSRVITVRLRLTNAGDAAISGSRAAAKHVRATLRGPGISPVTDTCAWNAAHGYFTCTIRIPATVKTGARWQYTITAAENVGTGFVPVPGVRGAADPEVVHFG
jgi:hypothetical protein